MPTAIKDDGWTAVVKVFLEGKGPGFAILALVIIVGLPAFLKNLPQIIKSIGQCYEAHRKTTAKIEADRQKLERAMEGRKKVTKKKGGKNVVN